MNSFLLTITACIVILFGALYIAPNYIQWNEYRDVFEDQASRIIGREVKVKGDVKLKLLPAPYLELQNITIFDRDKSKSTGGTFASKSHFIEVDAFKMWLAIPPLLQGNIKVEKLELARPHIFVRFNENGEANWQKLGVTDGIEKQYSWTPSQISFDSINIHQGKLSIFQAGNNTPLQLDGVNGQLSAESLKGPYRFAGNFIYLKEERKLSFSTGQQDELGVLKISSLLESTKTGSRYSTKGELRGFDSIPSFKGKLVGALPVTLLSMLNEENNETSSQTVNALEEEQGGVFNINADVSSNLKRIELNNLVIAVDDARRPQNISGFAVLDWNKGFNVKARMKATWLDLDQMFGVEGGAKTVAKTRGTVEHLDKDSVQSAFNLFVTSLKSMGNVVSRAAIHAEVADAKLGGSQVGNFELHLIKNRDRFRIAKLSARLPGRNHLDLSGDLVPGDKNLSFSGPVSIKGISLGALSHWAFIKGEKKTVFASNPYFLKGNVSYSPEKFEINDLRGDLNGAGLSGLFKYDFTARKEFALEVDSDKVDLRDIVSKDATLKSLLLGLFSSGKSSDEVVFNPVEKQQENSIVSNLVNLQGRVKLRIGRIQTPTLTGRDIAIDGRLSGGQFALRSFKMIADDGLRINGRGQIRNLNRDAEGNVRFSVEADTARALKTLIQQVEGSKSLVENSRLHKDLSPVRLAVTLNMNSRGLPSTDISVAGTLAQSQLTINARHEGSIDTLGGRQIDLSGSLINPKASSLLDQLVRDRRDLQSNENGQGAFSLQASGVPSRSLSVRARLDAGSTQASFRGNMTIKNGSSSGKGNVSIKSPDAAAGLSLLGVENTSAYSGETMSLTANLSKRAETYRVSQLKGQIGSMSIRGNGAVDYGSQPTSVDFTGSVSKVSLPAMLSYLSPTLLPDNLRNVIRATGAQLEGNWSNRPFDASKLKSLQGKVSINFKDLELFEDLRLENGTLRANMQNGVLSFSRLRGQIYNGNFSASGSLSSDGGPIALKASVALEKADLAELFRDQQNKALARGVGTFSVDLSGEGLSPLGLVSELSGRGRLRIRSGEIFNFSPDAVSELVANLQGKPDKKQLTEKFWSSLQGKSFPVNNVRAKIGVTSGTLNIKGVSLKSRKARANINAMLELASLKLDSEWVLQPRKGRANDLPGVRMVFAGPVSKIPSTAPTIDMGQLSQLLAVREIEQNFDTLEKLDKGDPETIRKLQKQKQERDTLDRRRRITDIDIRGRNTGENSSNQSSSFSNLGAIDNNQNQSTQDNLATENSSLDNQDQIAEKIRQQLAEEKRRAERARRKREREKEKERSIFDDLFGESGG